MHSPYYGSSYWVEVIWGKSTINPVSDVPFIGQVASILSCEVTPPYHLLRVAPQGKGFLQGYLESYHREDGEEVILSERAQSL